jgi:hypothetical protein
MSTVTIDHPLDPENAYLTYAVVASPEMTNVYTGTVILDEHGTAVVELPSWFEALNQDVRYQLTAIGAPAPNLYIAQEIRNSLFTIAGGRPGMKVCWLVTGVRHDPYTASQHMLVEVVKPAHERGSYLHPAAYGQPTAKSREYARIKRMWGIGSATPAQPSPHPEEVEGLR